VRSCSFNSNGLNEWSLERIYEYELSTELTGKKRKFDASEDACAPQLSQLNAQWLSLRSLIFQIAVPGLV